jgi:pimeloyl-ACP methyl ester carboxylesterase
VLLCHGFPESWYSWRHQLSALAAAGFHAVAPDMRGYGKSDCPEALEHYTLFHVLGDMVGLLDALEASTAIIVGHDTGANVAWQAALMRPDRFRAVIGLSVPFRPRGKVPPTSLMPRTEDAQFYHLYFQEPGIAEAELEQDPRATIRNMLYGASGGGGAPSARCRCRSAPASRRWRHRAEAPAASAGLRGRYIDPRGVRAQAQGVARICTYTTPFGRCQRGAGAEHPGRHLGADDGSGSKRAPRGGRRAFR